MHTGMANSRPNHSPLRRREPYWARSRLFSGVAIASCNVLEKILYSLQGRVIHSPVLFWCCVLIEYYFWGWLGSFVSDGNFHRFSMGFPLVFQVSNVTWVACWVAAWGRCLLGLRGFVVVFCWWFRCVCVYLLNMIWKFPKQRSSWWIASQLVMFLIWKWTHVVLYAIAETYSTPDQFVGRDGTQRFEH